MRNIFSSMTILTGVCNLLARQTLALKLIIPTEARWTSAMTVNEQSAAVLFSKGYHMTSTTTVFRTRLCAVKAYPNSTPRLSFATSEQRTLPLHSAGLTKAQASLQVVEVTVSNPASITRIPATPPSPAHKRGVAYNNALFVAAFRDHVEISWAYNWAATTDVLPLNIEYVPLLWGLEDHVQNWRENMDKAIAAGVTHLLAFNEPDLGSQASLDVSVAARAYLEYMQPFAGKAKLGSPAVTSAPGENVGLGWLQQFISICSACTLDFISIHWYDGGNFDAFKAHVMRAYEVGKRRPIWITEFRVLGTQAEEVAFLQQALPWLDSQEYIHRYAYFMAAEGILISL